MTRKFKNLFCLLGMGLFAQPTMADVCDALVSECHFETENNLIKEVKSSGYATPRIGVNTQMFVPQDKAGDSLAEYGFTSNPKLIDPTFIDVDKNMLVFRMPEEGTINFKNLLTYEIDQLVEGSDYEVSFTVYLLNQPDDFDFITKLSDISASVNPDMYGYGGTTPESGTRLDFGKSNELPITIKGTLKGEESIKLQISAGAQMAKGITIGITDIKVKGCYVPKVVSAKGLEICIGEKAFFTLDKEYDATSYKWMMKSPNAKDYSEISTTKNVYEELDEDGEYSIYCEMDGMVTDTLDVRAKACCVDASGNPMSQLTIFNEDFGYFIDQHTYVDSKGNETTTPSTYAPERADISWDLTALSKMKFDSNGQINDGSYGVIVPRENGYFADVSGQTTATWMNGVTSDHSSLETGKKRGASLFMNPVIGFSGVIFEKKFENICPKDYIAEVYIAALSEGKEEPSVEIRFKDAETGKIISKNRATAKANGGWIPVRTKSFIDSPFILEIVSLGGEGDLFFGRQGDDLIIDDIRLKTCAPPTVELFASEYLTQDTTISEDTDIKITAGYGKILESYYGNEQLFLYQKSTDGNKWDNIGEATTANNIVLETEALEDGVNYLRVIVASEYAMDIIKDDPYISYDDPCRNFSVSKAIKVTRNVPCTLPAPEVREGFIEGPTERTSKIHPDSIANVSPAFWVTRFDEFVDEQEGTLLWSETPEGPWSEDVPEVDCRAYEPNIEIVFYAKRIKGSCESPVVKVSAITREVTNTGNVTNIAATYYVEGGKLVVNAAEGSQVALYTPLGLTIASEKATSNSLTFNTKGQDIVILVVDGKAYKVVTRK